ncbi:MAG: TPM domain-containing protein [Thermoanaerobaculum sp.]
MRPEELFDVQGQQEVTEAVKAVERESAAEVVPVVVSAAGNYPQAPWRAASLGALGGAALVSLFLRMVDVWGLPLEFWVVAPPFLGAGLGVLLTRTLPSVARLLLTPEEMATQVRERAEHAFLTEEVFATKGRTGMLILVALFERQVVVLGDRGIAARIPQERWQSIANHVAQGIRQGRPVQALVAGIRQCGQLLVEAGVTVQPGDTNELSDQLRLSER